MCIKTSLYNSLFEILVTTVGDYGLPKSESIMSRQIKRPCSTFPSPPRSREAAKLTSKEAMPISAPTCSNISPSHALTLCQSGRRVLKVLRYHAMHRYPCVLDLSVCPRSVTLEGRRNKWFGVANSSRLSHRAGVLMNRIAVNTLMYCDHEGSN